MNGGHKVFGGLLLARIEHAPTDLTIRRMPPPAQLVLPLKQHRGIAARPVVAVGDNVAAGQCIASADDRISAALHAPAAGRVVAIEAHDSIRGCGLQSIVIETRDSTPTDASAAPPSTTPRYDAAQLRRRIADAGIAGLGGAAFPTAAKLDAQADGRVHTLLVNGAECDPGIVCDDALMRAEPDAIVAGTRMLLDALAAPRAVIAIKTDKTQAIAALRGALQRCADQHIDLVEVPPHYPMGGERQLIQYLSGREVPTDGLPRDIGYSCYNVATAHAVHRALTDNRPLVSRVVSVSGDAVAIPCVVEVPIGASVADVIAFCGGYREKARRLVLGGRMMGTAVASDAVAITKEVNAIEALARVPETRPAHACIRCGDCAAACPASLEPQQLHWHASAGQLDALLDAHLSACIECGCCDAVCPSHLPLTAQFKSAKQAVYERDEAWLSAQHARVRYDARNERLERQQRERAERRAIRQARATKAPEATRKSDILAAVARARRARAEREQQRDD